MIQRLLLILLIVLFSWTGLPQLHAAEALLSRTPADQEGPFYPVTRQQDIDHDLTQVRGQEGRAKGDILNLAGLVVTSSGDPLESVTIEIWQTDPQGRYRHPADPSPGERDPNFQYWGFTTTDRDGSFFFRTIVPGAYQPRPAHIHFKVLQEGKVVLTSQIYFRQPDYSGTIPPGSPTNPLQTVDLKKTESGEFAAFFRIVL